MWFVFSDCTLSYFGFAAAFFAWVAGSFKFPGLKEKILMLSRCFIELWSVASIMSLCRVELCWTEEGLLPEPPLRRWKWDPALPWLFPLIFGEIIPLLFAVVVDIVNVDGFEMHMGLLFTSLTLWGGCIPFRFWGFWSAGPWGGDVL